MGTPSLPTCSAWQSLQETATLPPFKSVPWQLWHSEKFQFRSRTRYLWNSGSFGFMIPPSWMPERKKDSSPGTTHSCVWAKAAAAGAWWF